MQGYSHDPYRVLVIRCHNMHVNHDRDVIYVDFHACSAHDHTTSHFHCIDLYIRQSHTNIDADDTEPLPYTHHRHASHGSATTVH